jgi:hypothetical protein
LLDLVFFPGATPAGQSRPTPAALPNQSEPYRTSSPSPEAIRPNLSEPNRTKPNPLGPKSAPPPISEPARTSSNLAGHGTQRLQLGQRRPQRLVPRAGSLSATLSDSSSHFRSVAEGYGRLR